MYSVLGPAAPTKTSYLSPAAYSFYIWTLIDLLLLGTVIVQFTDAGFAPIVEGACKQSRALTWQRVILTLATIQALAGDLLSLAY